MTTFQWAKGSRLTNAVAEAQAVGETLEQLAEENDQQITPALVVSMARPVSSVLHPIFEWDDTTAAELHREHQARHVLAAIRVVQPCNSARDPQVLLHAYVNLTTGAGDDRQRSYLPIARVMDDADLLQRALEQAGSELRAFERRYAEFEAIARAVRRARMEIEGDSVVPRIFDGAEA